MKNLKSYEMYTLSILFIYTLLAVLFFNSVKYSRILIFVNIILSLLIIYLANNSNKSKNNSLIIFLRSFIFIPIIYFIYVQVHSYIRIVNPYDYDNLLIACDQMMFKCNPTQILSKISHPVLTEYLQISYLMYFVIPVVFGLEIYRRKDRAAFDNLAGSLLFAYYISYLLYFILPAVGPRFTLHDFNMISKDLPGLWITDTLREIVNRGGGIISTAANPVDLVNRDCMPSGHTMMTMVNMILAFKFISKFKWIFLVIGSSLIFATVYLRYHYIIDLVAGAIFALIVIWLEPKINSLIKKRKISIKN